MKHFIDCKSSQDFNEVLQNARSFKNGDEYQGLQGKTLGMVFFNPSLRTRMSTELAAKQLGMDVLILSIGKDSWNLEFEEGAVMSNTSQEHIKEAAGVISEYCDFLAIRTFPKLDCREEDYSEMILNSFIRNVQIPIMSMESATRHPLQGVTDALTIEEFSKSKPKVVLTWVPHPKKLPQAVSNSLIESLSHLDIDLVVTHPKGMELSPTIIEGVKVVYDQDKALEGADIVYAKNWSSYTDYGGVKLHGDDWKITDNKMSLTNDARFMHCLPVRRNVVVDDQVLDSEKSVVLKQAGNRLHVAKAALKFLNDHGYGN